MRCLESEANDMIRIPTGQLGEDGYTVEGEEPADWLDLDRDPVARPDGPVRYELTATPAGPELVVTGWVEAPLKLLCGRCAQFFSTTVRVSAFLHSYEWNEHPDFLDVSGDVREDILLEIPGYPLCKADCKGLCPRCGRNLNQGACGCPPPEAGPSAWSALDALDTAGRDK